jgi:hypothetical protein
MWIALSAAAIIVAWCGCFALVQAARHRPAGSALALSAALLVSVEAVLHHLLSPWSAIGRTSVLLGNGAFGAAALLLLRSKRGVRRVAPPWAFVARQAQLIWVAPLGVLAGAAAIEWVPNNWDCMTYHLARVAYWIQYRSVAPHPTSIDRQIWLPPGAEYLALSLQAVAGTDRLDNLVQLAAWLSLVLCGPTLARAMGAPRETAPWAAVLIGTLPLALLQASSAQNDVVATLMTAALVVACMPFLHVRRGWRWPDLVLLAAAGAAAALVKATAVVAAAPFVAWALYAGARSLRERRDWAELGRGLVFAAALVAAVLGPVLAATLSVPPSQSAAYLYAGISEPLDRLVNAVRGIARQVPLPDALEAALAPAKTPGCPVAGNLCADSVLRFHEDSAGNVGQALLVAAALILGAIRWRRLPLRSRFALLCLPAAWLLFHALFRDNVWYARLQLPLLGLCGLALVSFSARPGQRACGIGALRPISILLAAYGALAVCRNEVREPKVVPQEVAFAGSASAYYVSALRGVEEQHAAVLAALAATGCRKLGLFIGADSYDYPLAWRAMQAGVEVHHLVASDDWPCMVFSDQGPPPPRPSGQWLQARPFLYLAR